MKHIHTLAFLILTSIIGSTLHAQDKLNSDSLATDFIFLVKQLEEAHPDPYSGFGGKVFFHKQVFELENEIRNNYYTASEFSDKVNIFLASLQDGHTSLERPQLANQQQFYLSVRVKVIPDGILLCQLPPAHKALLGSRIDSINGIALKEVVQKVPSFIGCENLYGSYAWLSTRINQSSFMQHLFPNSKENIRLSIETPDGNKRSLILPFVNKRTYDESPLIGFDEWKEYPSDYLAYKFIDKRKRTMLFKVASIMARENFEFIVNNKWSGSYDQIRNFYNYTLHKEMPQDTLKALTEIPSFSETFLHMLKEMKKQKSTTLIIDLRSNGGGWTPITLPTLYQLFGDDYLNTNMDTHFYRIISPLLMKKQNLSLDAYNKQWGSNYQFGDYTFDVKEERETSIDSIRESFINNCLSNVIPELKKQKGKPVYTPEKIYVLTNEWTFSAAFHYAFYLWKMGAIVVGVPSMQAPNTFMEQTPFQLPYTKLSSSISNSMQVFMPAKDRRAKIFWPDTMLTYKDYQKYQFDTHSEILYLLDLINP